MAFLAYMCDCVYAYAYATVTGLSICIKECSLHYTKTTLHYLALPMFLHQSSTTVKE